MEILFNLAIDICVEAAMKYKSSGDLFHFREAMQDAGKVLDLIYERRRSYENIT